MFRHMVLAALTIWHRAPVLPAEILLFSPDELVGRAMISRLVVSRHPGFNHLTRATFGADLAARRPGWQFRIAFVHGCRISSVAITALAGSCSKASRYRGVVHGRTSSAPADVQVAWHHGWIAQRMVSRF